MALKLKCCPDYGQFKDVHCHDYVRKYNIYCMSNDKIKFYVNIKYENSRYDMYCYNCDSLLGMGKKLDYEFLVIFDILSGLGIKVKHPSIKMFLIKNIPEIPRDINNIILNYYNELNKIDYQWQF